MHKFLSKEKVIDLSNVPLSDSGTPEPMVSASEGTLKVSYNTNRQNERVTVSFVKPKLHKFGFPNDEVLRSHRLCKKGLKLYAVSEVLNSEWIAEQVKANSVHTRHNPAQFKEAKHFIFAFHDSTFECIANDLIVES